MGRFRRWMTGRNLAPTRMLSAVENHNFPVRMASTTHTVMTSLAKSLIIIPLVCLAGSLSLAHAAEGDVAAQMARGKIAYMTCAACHGMDGKGLPTTPPMAPTLAGSKLLNGPAEIPAVIILKGIQKMDQQYLGIMAPLGAAMTDAQIADVLTYTRGNFGNTASSVSEEEVKMWREKYKEVNAPLPRSAYEKKSEKLAAEPAETPSRRRVSLPEVSTGEEATAELLQSAVDNKAAAESGRNSAGTAEAGTTAEAANITPAYTEEIEVRSMRYRPASESSVIILGVWLSVVSIAVCVLFFTKMGRNGR